MSTLAFPRILVALPLLLAATLLTCSDDDDDAAEPGGGDGTATQQPRTSTGGTGVSIDVCALVTAEEIEAIVGEPIAEGEAEESAPPFFGCRYESDDITRVVTIGVIAWDDADDAEASFDIGADQYEAVEGIGDRAYRSQPINDITVLSGRYEISVGLYFVSEDDDDEFEMAREIASTVIDRLP
jgi:hypothetical protein